MFAQITHTTYDHLTLISNPKKELYIGSPLKIKMIFFLREISLNKIANIKWFHIHPKP
jgi:hypothetical protein